MTLEEIFSIHSGVLFILTAGLGFFALAYFIGGRWKKRRSSEESTDTTKSQLSNQATTQ